jgi:hypothetical protein
MSFTESSTCSSGAAKQITPTPIATKNVDRIKSIFILDFNLITSSPVSLTKKIKLFIWWYQKRDNKIKKPERSGFNALMSVILVASL